METPESHRCGHVPARVGIEDTRGISPGSFIFFENSCSMVGIELMKKPLAIVLAIFFVLVFFDWIGKGAGAFLAPGGTDGLAQVDFAFFSKNNLEDYITQGYGYTSMAGFYIHAWHNGIDIAAQYGATVLSATDGTVLGTGNQDDFCYKRGFGKFIAIQDTTNRNLVLFYAHLGTIKVEAGDEVKKGELIGTIGTTGLETGTHLHFSVFSSDGFSIKPKNGCGPGADGKDMNPMRYLPTFQ